MRRSTLAMRPAGGVGGGFHGRRPLRPDVGPPGAGQRSRRVKFDFDDICRLPHRALAAASDPNRPQPEPEPELEELEEPGTTPRLGRRWRWSTAGPEMPRDAMSSVAPAGQRNERSAAAFVGAATAVDKLSKLVGYTQPPMHGIQDTPPSSTLLPHMPFGCGGNDHCPIGIPRRCLSTDSNRDSRMPHFESLDSMSSLQKLSIKTALFPTKRWIGMQPHRFFSTHSELPSPPQHSINFMRPSQEGPTRTAPFNIWTKGENTFLAAVNVDKLNCEKNQLCSDNLQKVFSHLEPAVRVRGLLSPFSLRDRRSRGLHSYYEKIVKKVTYITSYDLAKNYLLLPGHSRRPFLDFLCDERVVVSPDWESTNTFVRHTLYDHGLRFPPDYRSMQYKGESDASFDVELKKANIAIMIWKGDQVIWSEVLENIDCSTSVEGEALAMCLLLKRAVELSILSLEVCTDCSDVARVVQGDLVYESDEKKERLCKLYDLLRFMVGYFEELVCRWSPRENLLFVDSLMRNLNIFKDAKLDASGRSYTEKKTSNAMIKKWRTILNGGPIFDVKDKGTPQLKKTAMKNTQHPEDGLKTHSLCCHVVDGDGIVDKLNACWHIIRSLKPVEVHLKIKDVHSCLGMLKDIFGLRKVEDIFRGEDSDTVCLLFGEQDADDKTQATDEKGSRVVHKENLVKELEVRRVKRLNVVLDLEVLDTVRLEEDCLTVVLANLEEKHLLKDIEEFSPISVASFHSKS